jgi:hypothetical protein
MLERAHRQRLTMLIIALPGVQMPNQVHLIRYRFQKFIAHDMLRLFKMLRMHTCLRPFFMLAQSPNG